MNNKKHLFGQSERGATILEFALVLSIFFLFILGIFDVTSVLRQRFAINESLRSTGRFIVAQTERCNQQYPQAFSRYLEGTGVANTIEYAVLQDLNRQTIGGVEGISLSVRAKYQCLFCSFTFNALSAEMNAAVFVPVESSNTCPDV